MIQIKGQVVNLFSTEGGTNKQGEEYEGSDKVQLLGNVLLPNGDFKYDLVDLKVANVEDWKQYKNKKIAVDVGAYAPSKGNVIFFVAKGAKPQEVA